MVVSEENISDVISVLLENFDSLSTSDKQTALEMLYAHNLKKAATDFPTFVRIFAPLVLPDPFEEGEHIWLMARELQKVEEATRRGTKKRLQISIAPRSMKTVLLNLFIAWCFGRNPRWKIMHLSHTQEAVEDNSGAPIKDIISFPEYRMVFPNVLLRKDARSKKRWGLQTGGIYHCFGMNVGVAGRGANIVVVDDPLNEKQVESKADREKIIGTYVRGVRSRMWKLGGEIVIGTRYRVDDLLGYLQKLDGTEEHQIPGSKFPWKVIAIPMILDTKAANLLGLPEGGSYWPGTKTMEEIEETKRANTPKDWMSLYLQKPTLEEGNIFKATHFKWIKPNPMTGEVTPPDNIKFILVSMDTAFSTKEEADFSAICVYGLFDRWQTLATGIEKRVTNACLLDFKLGRWAFPDLCAEAQALHEAFNPDLFVIENKASGQSLIQELTRRGLPCHAYNPDRDKVTRAHAITPIHNAGRIWFPTLKFAQELYEELKTFPQGAHDDAADAHTLALTYLKDTYEIHNPDYLSEREPEDTNVVYSGRPSSYFAAASGNL